MENERKVKFHHRLLFGIVKGVSFIYTRLFCGFRCKDRYKIKKGERVVAVSNHQTDIDPFCLLPCFNRPVFPVATDSIFSGRFLGKFFHYLGVIPKKKGATDLRSSIEMSKTIKDGGSLMLFPEGNRAYAEFQYFVSPSIIKFIRKTGATLLIFGLHGGSGVSPRFKRKNRRGKFWGELKKVITPEEFSKRTDEEIFEEMMSLIKIYDSESGEKYKSSSRAEYIERMFFICPACGKMQTVYSKKHEIFCKNCGKIAEYTEDLGFIGEGSFPFTKTVEWWNYQKQAVKNLETKEGETIFSDEVKLLLSDPFCKRKLLFKGVLRITPEYIECGEQKFFVKDIEAATVVSGKTFIFSYLGHDYSVKSGRKNVRFNPLKYVFLLNKLDSKMKLIGSDKYFNLED